MRVTHLNKSGSGMSSKTACGRNILRTPISTNWTNFKLLPVAQQCEKCLSSKQYAFNLRSDCKQPITE